MCLPLPYRIACDCTIQPVKRRYVAAPYDGILDRAHVKKGDLVEANAVVADMDEGNLRIELSAVEAELAAARKRRDSALALGEVAKSQIARSEMRRHQAEIELLQQQLTNLEIRSPIDGLVVAGDLEKAEGAPLEMGQTVFEIAPLDRMVAEIAIDESEIPYARPGMDVTIKLNAFPFRKWQGTVQSISPSTEIVKDDSVFIAEVEIVNAEMLLKPGMEGSAKIVADRAPLGWSLFHRPYESLRYWMIW
jgi:RND family efflux transporter MFP subunit